MCLIYRGNLNIHMYLQRKPEIKAQADRDIIQVTHFNMKLMKSVCTGRCTRLNKHPHTHTVNYIAIVAEVSAQKLIRAILHITASGILVNKDVYMCHLE